MTVPEKIWQDISLDTIDKLILALILRDGKNRTPKDIATELGTSQKKVAQKINRMCKEGHLTIIKAEGKISLEVNHGRT